MAPLRSLCVALALTAACATPSVTSSEAQALVVQHAALLVDVRNPEEFAQGHLPGAINVPVGDLPGRLDQKDQDVVVYCRSGHRSAQAAAVLTRAGFTKVHDLGAMSNWK